MRIRAWKSHPDFPVSDQSPFRGCWEYELKMGEHTVPHQHEDGDEINITLEGSGRITVGDVTRELRAGEVVFVPAGVSHFLENNSSQLLRGIAVETTGPFIVLDESDDPASIREMEEIIQEIPEDLNESEALQLIIRLFDMAGRLSEQIESTLGLESQTGYEALQQLERKVMGAVVNISRNYEGGPSFFRPRF